jgi:hypothetical protein
MDFKSERAKTSQHMSRLKKQMMQQQELGTDSLKSSHTPGLLEF